MQEFRGKAGLIESLTEDLGSLITGYNPDTPKEWEALEKLVQAHKTLRSIDLPGLAQMGLEE